MSSLAYETPSIQPTSPSVTYIEKPQLPKPDRVNPDNHTSVLTTKPQYSYTEALFQENKRAEWAMIVPPPGYNEGKSAAFFKRILSEKTLDDLQRLFTEVDAPKKHFEAFHEQLSSLENIYLTIKNRMLQFCKG